MKRKKLKVLGLSYSQSQSGSYVIVLSEVGGTRKIPVIVKSTDAQNIAVKLENIKTKRPSTHDLFKSLTDTYSIDIQEVFIYSILEGVFYNKIIAHNGVDETEIECNISDAITLALTYDCPIMVHSDVLDSAGIDLPSDLDEDYDLEEDLTSNEPISIEDLEKMMQTAIENEEYEVASELRDKISELKNKN